MASSAQVRTTRDGDQFHYLWAARRCLRLLDAASDLKAVSVEGLSSKDAAPGARAGEEVVDVAEYYGAETLPQAREVHYLQLKHSTVRTDQDWTASGLANTLKGFGLQHAELVGRHGEAGILAKVRYGFVSNRPVSAKVRASVRELGAGVAPTHARIAADLVKATKLPSALVPGFFGRLQFFDSEAKFSDQAGILTLEAANFLAGDDLDAALRLHRFVSDKATSIGKDEPAIRAGDVLLALRTGPNQLLPAPSHLVADPDAVPRRQEREIADSIARAATPVLILAPGGVGKSVLATRLPDLMPTGSETVLFDCFANGEYRHLTHQRHPHGKALVQIANELATRGLCLPLIPTAAADPQDYMRGLVDRLAQASLAVRARGPEALVVILVDAADNAQMAADEANTPAFVRDLLRQRLPDGVRLAMLCRPERVDMLKPPQAALSIPLSGFELDETAALLRRTYPDATEAQVEEFHRLSTQNPRVQDNALSTETGLKATLRSLGPNPTSVSATIGAQLARAVAKLKDETPGDGGDIDTLCVALAVLRPFIPLKVLEAMTGLSISALHSFASDFGRGRWLLVSGDAVQFRDEPVETWFRETFSATRAQLETFLDRLTPLADAFPYVAATLPALMLNCGRLDDLIALALSSERLPADSPLERREIQVERLRFALRASLEAGRYLDASKLAAKAAEETAGQARHEALIEANVDLVGALLEPDRLQETAARRTFGRGWLGGRYAREAALLSAAPELRGEASNRLQIAEDLLWAWSRLKTEAREAQAITDDDRADLMLAQLNLRGPRTAVKHLLLWRPPHIWFETGRRIASRLVDFGRFEDLEAMALAAAEHKAGPLVAAITLALSQVSRYPPKAAVEAAVALPKGGGPGPLRQDDWQVDTGRDAMTALVEAAVLHGYADRTRLVRLLGHVLPKSPPRSLGADFHRGRAGYLRAYALRAALRGRTLPLNDLASEEVRESLTRPGGYRSHEADEFKSRVGASWPWWELRAGILVDGEPADLAGAIAAAEKVSTAAYGYYGAERSVQDEIAVARFDILCRTAAPTTGLVADFDHWVELQKRPMFVQTWTRIARMAARHPELKAHAHRYAHRPVAGEWNETGETADSQIDTLIGASRALLALDREEAGLLLDGAIEVASRMGDEVYTRWEAVLALADAAGGAAPYDPQLAYRLSRCAEFTADYIEKHFPWGRTIDAMAGLSPASAIAVVSRWRDRDLTWYRDLGNALWATLRRRRLMEADLGIALAGYRYGWSLEALLDDALDPASSPANPQTVFDIGVEAALVDGYSAKAWNAIVAAGAGQGLDVARAERARDAATAEEAREAARELAAKAEAAREAAPTTPTSAEAPPPPPAPLGRIRTIAEALAAEKARYGLDYDGDAFWRDAFAAVQGEDAAAFVRGALGPDGIDHYAQDRFFGALPAAWRERLAVKKALADGMKAFARRNGWIMLQRSHWGPAPIAAAAEWSGLTQAAVAQAALEGVAPEIDRTGSDNLFNLSGFLARRLTAAEAREALDYSLALIEAAMPEATGEGPWKPELAPAEDAERAMAGYIWGTLGAAERGLRWGGGPGRPPPLPPAPGPGARRTAAPGRVEFGRRLRQYEPPVLSPRRPAVADDRPGARGAGGARRGGAACRRHRALRRPDPHPCGDPPLRRPGDRDPGTARGPGPSSARRAALADQRLAAAGACVRPLVRGGVRPGPAQGRGPRLRLRPHGQGNDGRSGARLPHRAARGRARGQPDHPHRLESGRGRVLGWRAPPQPASVQIRGPHRPAGGPAQPVSDLSRRRLRRRRTARAPSGAPPSGRDGRRFHEMGAAAPDHARRRSLDRGPARPDAAAAGPAADQARPVALERAAIGLPGRCGPRPGDAHGLGQLDADAGPIPRAGGRAQRPRLRRDRARPAFGRPDGAGPSRPAPAPGGRRRRDHRRRLRAAWLGLGRRGQRRPRRQGPLGGGDVVPAAEAGACGLHGARPAAVRRRPPLGRARGRRARLRGGRLVGAPRHGPRRLPPRRVPPADRPDNAPHDPRDSRLRPDAPGQDFP